MKNITLDSAIRDAKALGSYLVTVTTRDKSRTENDLTHSIFREDFLADDIMPSLDSCVRALGIKARQPIPIVEPPIVLGEKKPLRIAILSHFNRCPDSYSPGKAVKNQIKILKNYGHEVVFFVAEGSKMEMDCEIRPVVPKFKREKCVVNEDAKSRFIKVLREQLVGFDLAITHDFYIDNCITYREAIKECGVNIKWLHWARSGVGRLIDFKMENARFVYMNKTDVGYFAEKINVDSKDVRVVFNEKDPSFMFGWEEQTKKISNKLRLWEKDIIQTYPLCTTRMDAKGLNMVIEVFGKLKKAGKQVALIICNSNGRRRIDEIMAKQNFAMDLGLDENDILFTSTLDNSTESELSYKSVVQLFQVSNLFVFPTIAEVCSNVMLEASMAKNLLVVNQDLPSLMDFADENSVLKYPFTSSREIHYRGRDDRSLEDLAKKIIEQIESNKADKQMRRVWGAHNSDTIYNKMLKPILSE